LLEVDARYGGAVAGNEHIRIDVIPPLELFAETKVGALDIAPACDQRCTIDHHKFVVHSARKPERVIQPKRMVVANLDIAVEQMRFDLPRQLVPLRVNQQANRDAPTGRVT